MCSLCLTCCRGFGDLKKNCASLHVSDFEPGEVNLVYVLLWTAEVIYGNKTQPQRFSVCLSYDSHYINIEHL